jgi:hypothetical protein
LPASRAAGEIRNLSLLEKVSHDRTGPAAIFELARSSSFQRTMISGMTATVSASRGKEGSNDTRLAQILMPLSPAKRLPISTGVRLLTGDIRYCASAAISRGVVSRAALPVCLSMISLHIQAPFDHNESARPISTMLPSDAP